MSVSSVYGRQGQGVIAYQMQMNKQKVQQTLQQAQDQGKDDLARKMKEIQQPSPYGGVTIDIKA